MAMIGSNNTVRESFKCGASVATTTSQYKSCYLSTDFTVSICTALTDKVVGIIDSYQTSDSKVCEVITFGFAKGYMLAGTVCSAGDMLTPAAGGTVTLFITNTSLQYLIGMAMDTPATAGAVTIYVNPQKYGIKS